jgi:hypothetical protein
MNLSKEDLLEIARKHYDSTNKFHFATEASPETQRLHALWAQWIADMSSWYHLRDKLSSELPNHNTGETYPTNDGGPRCMVYPPKESSPPTSDWVVVGCLSLLAPVYFVYGVKYNYIDGRLQNPKASFEPPPPGMEFPARVVARTIETTFGYSALSREIAETPVPLFAGWLAPPQTTLFHVLFTNDPSNIP